MLKTTLLQLARADTHCFWLIAGRAGSRPVRALARLISRLADGPLYLALGMLLALVDGQHGQQFLIAGLASYGLQVPSYVLLKRFFRRARPFRRLNCWHSFVPADEFSFPSGHTAAAAVFACLLSSFYVDSTSLLVAGVTMVGASRVVLGVHYPGDILAGALLGCSCAWWVLSVF